MSAIAEANAVSERIYHTRILNSTFIVQRHDKEGKPVTGQVKVLQFHGDTLRTTDAEAVSQLDAVCEYGNCPIYIDGAIPSVMSDEKAPFADVKKRAGEIVEQMAKAGQRA